jgi:ABC-2 type transport system permease protein
MNADVFALTLREFVGQRRSLLICLLAAVPVALALIIRATDPDTIEPLEWTANTLMEGTIITTILPLSCLLLGTAAFGNEIDSGTVLYLVTKPISRSEIVVAKFAAAASLTMTFLVSATALSGFIVVMGSGGDLVVGFTIAVAVGILAYTAVFTLVSLVTSRALLVGLAYVFVWEAGVTELFSATAYLSIRQYTLGIADLLSGLDPDIFQADIAGPAAPILAIAVTLAALALSIRRLERLQITAPAE